MKIGLDHIILALMALQGLLIIPTLWLAISTPRGSSIWVAVFGGLGVACGLTGIVLIHVQNKVICQKAKANEREQ